jgi:hypothetical protein
MHKSLCLFIWLLIFTAALFCDGEQDNHPDKVRQIPRLGVEVPEADVIKLKRELEVLKNLLNQLKLSKQEIALDLIPDVEIYFRAVKDNLEHQEFFHKNHIKLASKLLGLGQERARQLLKGEAPWTQQTGLVVRGFRSDLDDTVQPYGLVIPENYQPRGDKTYRMDLWFHGRGETLSETVFIDKQSRVVGYYAPKNTIVLHPYGRYSNAFKFAGEVDVWEAVHHAKSQYRIDEDRMSVRGFSMGGAGCWQFAHLYSDKWFAANPGAGFSETPEFLKTFQNEILKPYWWEEKLWRWYDSDDNAMNLYHVPLIAYSGEDDRQIQAAQVMEKAMSKEGMDLVHIIGLKMGHKIHPDSQVMIEEKMASIAKRGKDQLPLVVNKIAHSLKYNRQYWLTITEMKEHWEPSRVRAEIIGNEVIVHTLDVMGLRFEMKAGLAPFELMQPISLMIDGQKLTATKAASDRSWTFECHRFRNKWKAGARSMTGLKKQSGLQGPIDDAFLSSFLMVTPSRQPMNDNLGKWVQEEQTRAIKHWRQHFRGHARVKKDKEVSEEDIAKHNLILWGDYASNRILAKIIARLPLNWNHKELSIGAETFYASTHAPIMIYPNPMNPEKYIVINSGFTYREYAYLNNARQVPMLPDWAIVDIVSQPEPNDARTRFAGIPKDANFFDETWQVK